MKLFAVRDMEDNQAVGFFWCQNDVDLVHFVDEVCDPSDCEYVEVVGPGAFVWDNFTKGLGVNRDISTEAGYAEYRQMVAEMSPLGEIEGLLYGEEFEGLWLPVTSGINHADIERAQDRLVRAAQPVVETIPRLPRDPVVDVPLVNVVYFIGCGPDKIKIGQTTGDPTRRLRALSTGHYEELVLLAAIENAPGPLEFELHQRFAALRIRGEWFRAEPELLAYIAEVNNK